MQKKLLSDLHAFKGILVHVMFHYRCCYVYPSWKVTGFHQTAAMHFTYIIHIAYGSCLVSKFNKIMKKILNEILKNAFYLEIVQFWHQATDLWRWKIVCWFLFMDNLYAHFKIVNQSLFYMEADIFLDFYLFAKMKFIVLDVKWDVTWSGR